MSISQNTSPAASLKRQRSPSPLLPTKKMLAPFLLQDRPETPNHDDFPLRPLSPMPKLKPLSFSGVMSLLCTDANQVLNNDDFLLLPSVDSQKTEQANTNETKRDLFKEAFLAGYYDGSHIPVNLDSQEHQKFVSHLWENFKKNIPNLK